MKSHRKKLVKYECALSRLILSVSYEIHCLGFPKKNRIKILKRVSSELALNNRVLNKPSNIHMIMLNKEIINGFYIYDFQ